MPVVIANTKKILRPNQKSLSIKRVIGFPTVALKRSEDSIAE
tara:strand:- start:304 stop:429 length:126 start_codon:yes stop_codon:yes gene_type:complete